MYGYESWTINKVECQRIDAFKLWCWRKFLRVHWTASRSSQSIIKEINTDYSKDWRWSWSSNALATWCEELTSLEKTLMLGKIEGRRRRERQRMRWLDDITDSMDMSLSKLHALEKEMATLSSVLAWKPGGLLSMPSHRVGHDWSDLAAAGDGGGQGILACYSAWCYKESDMTEPLNNNNKKFKSDPFLEWRLRN